MKRKLMDINRRAVLKGAAGLIGLGALGYGLNALLSPKSAQTAPEAAGPVTRHHHPRTGVEVSAFGYGCMRLPMLPSASSPRGTEVDEKQAFALIDHALACGVNYFDSAHFYHKGVSESVMGRALSRHPRESYLVATKMPGRIIESLDQAKEIFEGQLQKCRTGYFDFYQLHAVMGVPSYKHVYEDLGVLDYLLEKREKGIIRHLGWSFHGDSEALDYLLAQPVTWDYAMLQLNYHDLMHELVMPEKRKQIVGLSREPAPARWMYERVRDAGIPIVVMEPLLGGRLARLGKKAAAPLQAARPDLTPAAWAFRYAATLPGVLTVLSGVTRMDYLQENLRTFSPLEPFTPAERQALESALKLFLTQESLPCTTCGYCMPCPYGIDIPAVFSQYNRSLDHDLLPRAPETADYPALRKAWLADLDRRVPELRQAARCTGCGKCVEACPAMIDIPAEMSRLGQLTERLHNEEMV
ncbi:MAG: 4Fe-4S binding protein [Desulfovibrio sp.]|nr:4Fe-4S binding protein [Desulfovibrio sp.]